MIDTTHDRIRLKRPENGPRAPLDNRKVAAWVQACLVCLAFAYPAFWLANSVSNALPAFLRVSLEGYRLTWVRVSRFGIAAASVRPDVFAAASGGTQGNRYGDLWVSMVAVAMIAAALGYLGRKQRLLSGLFLAMLGEAGLTPAHFRSASAGRMNPSFVLEVIFYFAVLVVGLRWMLQAWFARTYRGRVLNLLAGFVFFPGLIWALTAWRAFFEILASEFFLSLAVVGLAAACLAALRLRPPQYSRTLGWKWLVAGLSVTAAIPLAAQRAELAQERAQHARWESALAAYAPAATGEPYPKVFFQKGISFAAEGPGGYESESAVRMLDALPRFGVNAIALIPYGFERRGSTDIEIGGSLETDEGLGGLARVAHARGMKIMLKPGLWVGSGGFAGELDFPDPPARARWFESYRRLVEHYAGLAGRMHADVFCIGGEFVNLSGDDADWRRLITRARELYPGPIVYAANFGPEFETLTFWDALDYIGLQEYYPLPDDLSTAELVAKVEAVEKKYAKPVLFTEAGFPSLARGNRRPWDDSGGDVSADLQARAYDALFKAFYGQPWFEGVYWWKVATDGRGGPADATHTPWGKPAMQVIARYYLGSAARR